MKKIILLACLGASCSLPTAGWAATYSPCTTEGSNNPGVFFGVTYAFGGKESVGFTLGVTSSRRDDRGVVAAGVSYYPRTGNIGIPVGVGYQKNDALLLGGYDFLLKAPVVNGAHTNTSRDRSIPCIV